MYVQQGLGMTLPHHLSQRSMRKNTGFTLIELLISMAMGIALMAVVLLSFQNISGGSRLGAAQQQMNEDAQAAFQILGQQIRSAGYNPIRADDGAPPRNLLSPTPLTAGEVGMAVFGCDQGFFNGSGGSAATQMSALTCTNSGSSGAIAVQYEVDQFSPNASAIPADCRGSGISDMLIQNFISPTVGANSDGYRLVENRYYIANGGLSCTGNGGAAANRFTTQAQPLVGNIESMTINYGLVNPTAFFGNTTATIAAAQFVSGYLTASQIGGATGAAGGGVDAALTAPAALTGSNRWGLVRTVRVCLVVKSATPALVDVLGTSGSDSIYGYYSGCNPADNTQISITNRFLRKSYVMHFAVRNRISITR